MPWVLTFHDLTDPDYQPPRLTIIPPDKSGEIVVDVPGEIEDMLYNNPESAKMLISIKRLVEQIMNQRQTVVTY